MDHERRCKYPPSDCTPAELSALSDLGERFRGDGVICDVGCGNGGSTAAFAIGLESKGSVERSGQIHAFDWFDYRDNTHAKIDCFQRNTEEWRDFITLHNGDITKTAARFDEPIEILFIDIAKSRSAHKASMSLLRCLANDWIVINQDAGRPHLTYIQYSLDEIINVADKYWVVDDMVLVSGRSSLSGSLIERLASDSFTNADRLRGIESFYERVGPGEARNGIPYSNLKDLTLCFFFLELGKSKEAFSHLVNFKRRVPIIPPNLEAVVNIAEKNVAD